MWGSLSSAMRNMDARTNLRIDELATRQTATEVRVLRMEESVALIEGAAADLRRFTRRNLEATQRNFEQVRDNFASMTESIALARQRIDAVREVADEPAYRARLARLEDRLSVLEQEVTHMTT